MQVIRAMFDGQDIKPIEPIKTKYKTEVLVIFPNETSGQSPAQARRLLRGSGKGQGLTAKLLKARAEDKKLDRN